MSTILLNLFLALIWALSTGEVSLENLVLGYLAGFVIIWITQPVIGSSPYVRKVIRLANFVIYVNYHLVTANLRLVRDVLRPIDNLSPGIVQINLEAESDVEIILLANVISLMPGTLSLDVSDDRRHLYVHALQLRNRDAFVRWIKEGLEPQVLGVTRWD